MFIERLSEISDRIDGALALSLVAEDGIIVESVSSSPDLELEMLSAELIAQVKAIAENHRDLVRGRGAPAHGGDRAHDPDGKLRQ